MLTLLCSSKLNVINFSQKCRLVEIGRDLWRVSGPTPLLKQGHTEQDAQDHVQAVSEYLQAWRRYSLSGQPVPLLSHLHSKELLLDVQTAYCVPACVHSFLSWNWAPMKRAWLHLIAPFLQANDEISRSLLFFSLEQAKLSQLFLR